MSSAYCRPTPQSQSTICLIVARSCQNVLILAAIDGLHGGRNLDNEQTVSWIRSGVQWRGAQPTVIWADMPKRRM